LNKITTNKARDSSAPFKKGETGGDLCGILYFSVLKIKELFSPSFFTSDLRECTIQKYRAAVGVCFPHHPCAQRLRSGRVVFLQRPDVRQPAASPLSPRLLLLPCGGLRLGGLPVHLCFISKNQDAGATLEKKNK